MAWIAPIPPAKSGCQEPAPGALTPSSAPATQQPFISRSFYFLNSNDMMTSDLALTASIFTILFQIPHGSEDTSNSEKKQIELFWSTCDLPEASLCYTSWFSYIIIIISFSKLNTTSPQEPWSGNSVCGKRSWKKMTGTVVLQLYQVSGSPRGLPGEHRSPLQYFWLSGSRVGPENLYFDKLPWEADAAGLDTTLWLRSYI